MSGPALHVEKPDPPWSVFGVLPLGGTFAILLIGELVFQFAWIPVKAVIDRHALMGGITPTYVFLTYAGLVLALSALVFLTGLMIGRSRFCHAFAALDSRAIAIVVIAAGCDYVLTSGSWLAQRDILHIRGSAGYVSSIFAMSLGTPVAPYIAARMMIIGPMFEEIQVRGLLLGVLVTRLGWGPAALISSAVFSLLHFEPHNFLPLMISGLIFAFVLRKTGSLWAPYMTHVIVNTTATLKITLHHLHH